MTAAETGPDDSDRLARLSERLHLAKTSHSKPEAKSFGAEKFTSASLAWRMVIELVVGLMIGCAIGLGLDSLFGTQPVFLVIFVLVGFAAGVRTMLATAKEVTEKRGEAAMARRD